jgi:hypothetical protein
MTHWIKAEIPERVNGKAPCSAHNSACCFRSAGKKDYRKNINGIYQKRERKQRNYQKISAKFRRLPVKSGVQHKKLFIGNRLCFKNYFSANRLLHKEKT